MQSFVLNDMIEYDPKLRVRKPIFKVPTYVSEIVCYEPGQTTAMHHHPNQDEIWLVLEGKGEITVGDAVQPVEQSSFIFIPAGIRHGLVAADDSRLVLLFIKSPGIPGAAAPGSDNTNTSKQATKAAMQLEVADIRAEARDVVAIELKAQGGAQLPAFEPGAHLPIDLPNGLRRHYSISSDWRERDHYVVGVARAPESRGGSVYAHQYLKRGMLLNVNEPRNNFPLVADAKHYLFIAGGIGITPLMAMMRWCTANNKPWSLVYAVRSAQRAAFLESINQLGGGTVHLHEDDRMGSFLDPIPWLKDTPAGEHVYCCGPAPMMAAVKEASAHRDPGTIHFEYFAAPEDEHNPDDDRPFTIELKSSGKILEVPKDKSILEILEANGIEGVISSCREGTCRTCETGICSGEVDHRDFCQTPEEQAANKTMMVCVSRAKSEHLVLDL